jgi:hypothetical protein
MRRASPRSAARPRCRWRTSRFGSRTSSSHRSKHLSFHRREPASALFIQNRRDLSISFACGSGLGGANHVATLRRQIPDCESPPCRSLPRVATLTQLLTDEPLVQGTLHQQPSGRWAILRLGREPFELTSGDVFRVEVDGKLQITRMGHLRSEGYYSVEGYTLRDGMRAAIGVEALPRKKRKCPTKASSAGCPPVAGRLPPSQPPATRGKRQAPRGSTRGGRKPNCDG